MEHIKQVRLEPGEISTSYDVKALFTSVPVDPFIQIVLQKLSQDPTLPQRTNMPTQQIIKLLEFCLKNTYFLFQCMYHEQVHGAAMGSPLALSLPTFSCKSLRSNPLALPHTPHFWLRFVNDTFIIQKAEHSQQLLHDINMQDPNIQFTVEEPDQDGYLPFLDTKVTPGPNNTIITTVYIMPTQRDQYLHWNSNHYTVAKHSVYNTLAHRANVVSSNQPSLTKELDHIQMAIQSCYFPTWALNKLQHNFECRHYNNNVPSSTDSQHNNNHNNNGTKINNNNNKNISIVVPYIQGLGEKFKRTYTRRVYKYTSKVQTLSKHY